MCLEGGKAVGPEYNYWNDKENIVQKKKKENNLQESIKTGTPAPRETAGLHLEFLFKNESRFHG